MGIQPSFWRSNGKTDAAFLSVVNSAFHTNLPTALSAQTWLTSMGYYTNWFEIIFPLISISAYSTYSIKNGQVWDWGNGVYGKLGINSSVDKCTPVSIQGTKKTFCKITSGESFAFAIDKYNNGWTWGSNLYGELGVNSLTHKCTPVSIQGAKKTFCKISGGVGFISSLDIRGLAWGWGYNFWGQLGNNSVIQKLTPISILGSKKTFCEISAGGRQCLAIDYSGLVWGWGYNYYGQLGNNSIASSVMTPVSILGTRKTFCKIAASYDFSAGITKNGQVWTWGANTRGQLGINSASSSKLTPVSIQGTKKTFCKINTSNSGFATAIDDNGIVWSWGSNDKGQLGNNSILSVFTPVSLLGVKKTFCEIFSSGSGQHVTAIDKNGIIWGWGYNIYGSIGDGTETSRRTPVRVCNF